MSAKSRLPARITFQLEDEQRSQIDELAAREQMSTSDMVRRAVRLFLANQASTTAAAEQEAVPA